MLRRPAAQNITDLAAVDLPNITRLVDDGDDEGYAEVLMPRGPQDQERLKTGGDPLPSAVWLPGMW